jgi:hypothetical protein
MKSSRLLSRLSRAATLRIALAGLLVVPFAACGGGGGGGTTTGPSQPTGPSRANITVTCGSYSLSLSPLAGFNYRISFPCTITEAAGLGANLNFVRASFTLGGVEIERQEIGSNVIIAVNGSNRLPASGRLQGNFIFDFNAGNATGGRLEFNFTDDRGNNLSATFTFTA